MAIVKWYSMRPVALHVSERFVAESKIFYLNGVCEMFKVFSLCGLERDSYSMEEAKKKVLFGASPCPGTSISIRILTC